jgi:hypothetical protein
VAAGFFVAILLITVSWLANSEPLGVDETPISVGPHDRVIETLTPDPSVGRSLPEYRLSLGKEEVFSYLFWLHNDGPLPVSVTGVDSQEGTIDQHITDVRLGPVSGSAPTSHPASHLPYTIPPGADAAIEVHMYIAGCIENRVSVSVWGVPIAYETFGLIHHDTTITLPMVVTLVGPSDSPSCA